MIITEKVRVPNFNVEKTIRIYLPENYYNSLDHYPVLYMFDGQNLYDGRYSYSGVGWQIDECLKYLGKDVIVVGIDNANEKRMEEYSPFPIIKTTDNYGKTFATFVCYTLKAHIDKSYRTLPQRQHSAIGGSGMGGLLALYTGLLHNTTFQTVCCISVTTWLTGNSTKQFLDMLSTQNDSKVYISVGEKEDNVQFGSGETYNVVNDFNKLISALRKKGCSVNAEMFKNGEHHEKYWRKPFMNFVQYWQDLKKD